MSVQERIRALNLQNESGGGGNTSRPARAAKPAPTSPSSPKAHLFKAAKVIKHSFDAEADLLSQTLSGASSTKSDDLQLQTARPAKPSEGPARGADEANAPPGDGDDSHESEELDAAAALNFWKAKGRTSEGEGNSVVLRDGSVAKGATKPETSADAGEGKPPTPPEVVRTAHAGSGDGGGTYEHLQEQRVLDDATAQDLGQVGASPEYLDVPNEDLSKKAGHVHSLPSGSAGGLPYRAYARRSRLRSPRGTVGSPDGTHDMDGTQSVVSAMSAVSASSQATSLTQMSSLSSRAARFLKDKKGKQRKGTGADSPSPTAAGSPLSDTAGTDMSLRGKARMKQRAASGGGAEARGEGVLKMGSPFDEPKKEVATSSGPVTVDLPPAMPNTDHRTNSELNGEGGDRREQQQDYDYSESSQSQYNVPLTHGQQQQQDYDHSEPSQPLSQFSAGHSEKESGRGSVQTESMDGSSYSGLRANDLFDDRKRRPGHQTQATATSAQLAESKNERDAAWGNDMIIDSGCQVLEAFHDAFNAVSESATANIFGSDTGGGASSALRNDAPSDEDVAIEVEYVQDDGSVSISTRDDSIY